MSEEQAVVMPHSDIATTTDDFAIRAARRLSEEFSALACERLRAGETKDAAVLAQWQQCMEQLAAGSAVTVPDVRPARHERSRTA